MTDFWLVLGGLALVAAVALGMVVLIRHVLRILFPDAVVRYPSGRLKARGEYYHGLGDKQGLWTFFYESGQKEHEGTFVVGFESGVWSFWHANGQLRARGAINDAGRKEGEWHYWDADGQALTEAEYLARYPEDRLARWPPR